MLFTLLQNEKKRDRLMDLLYKASFILGQKWKNDTTIKENHRLVSLKETT